ncbi:hypothetical protein CDL12_16034 [Handroanthus impetiginosus]|uniref:Uncharacterized protein n=1 Tax=Handroanthus impetiginosus TaxID=429701 RepID=A0A2G9H1J3_9LAMI|nr:hypothetical protein CDL12_16034 [Handroanthus impetiginosus]
MLELALDGYSSPLLCNRGAFQSTDSKLPLFLDFLIPPISGAALCDHGVNCVIRTSYRYICLIFAPPPLEMEATFVSRARTAINSAAAKAEKVFTDMKKSDSITHRDLDKQSPSTSTPESPKSADEPQDFHEVKSKRLRPRPIKTKQDWHERLKNIRIGKRGPEDSEKPDNSVMAYAIFDDNLYLMGEREFSHSKVSLIP